MIADIVRIYRELRALAPEPDEYRVTMTMETYRVLWNTRTPMQRKLARMAQSSVCPPLKHNVRR